MQMEQIVEREQLPLSVKAIKFRKIAEYRMGRLLRLIAQLGNLSRRSTYDYTEAEAEQMFAALRAAIEAAEEKFQDKQRAFRFD
jgi:hypothetical protein